MLSRRLFPRQTAARTATVGVLVTAACAAVVSASGQAAADPAPALPPQVQGAIAQLPPNIQDMLPPQFKPAQVYPNNLDGWIRHALAIMAQHRIPGDYDSIYRNAMRESGGNPNAINDWDSNAAAGIPSMGLMQVIQPTFDAFHVDGTSRNIYDPVANIAAACNYAANRYGSINNVDGPY